MAFTGYLNGILRVIDSSNIQDIEKFIGTTFSLTSCSFIQGSTTTGALVLPAATVTFIYIKVTTASMSLTLTPSGAGAVLVGAIPTGGIFISYLTPYTGVSVAGSTYDIILGG